MGWSDVSEKSVNVKMSEATIGSAVKAKKPKIHGDKKIQPHVRCCCCKVLRLGRPDADAPVRRNPARCS